mgnify:CR=1 FL=1
MGIGTEDLQVGVKWWGGKGVGVGDSISGIVVSANKEQQTDFDSGDPLEWDNGDPRMESVIIVSEAINKSGIRCDTGVKITATITGMAKVTGRGRNAAKLWTIKLDKAPAGIGEADLFD